MTVEMMINALQTIEDKTQECYFDVTPAISSTLVFRSIDIIEKVNGVNPESIIFLSCGLKEPDQLFLN